MKDLQAIFIGGSFLTRNTMGKILKKYKNDDIFQGWEAVRPVIGKIKSYPS